MPYNPGIAYTGDRSIAQGRQNLMQAVMLLVGGLTEQGRLTKELRTELSALDPAGKEKYSKMSLGQLQGARSAMEAETKQTAANLLAQEMGQRIQLNAQKLQGESELGPFMQAWKENLGQTVEGPMPAGVQGPGAPQPMNALQAALAAGSQFPQGAEAAEIAPLLRAAAAAHMSGNGDMSQSLVPFTLGEGNNRLSGAIESRTGKTLLDPETTKRLAESRRAPMKQSEVGQFPADSLFEAATDNRGQPVAGLYKVWSKDRKFIGFYQNPRTAARPSAWDQLLNRFGGPAGATSTMLAEPGGGPADDPVRLFQGETDANSFLTQ